MHVIQAESVSYTQAGLEAIVFTADGDMRQALNNLQSTHSGFGHVSQENVFKVCDQPHPEEIKRIVEACAKGELPDALNIMKKLHDEGYSCADLITTIFRVVKYSKLPEDRKLKYIKQIGLTHMRVSEGARSLLQLNGLLARMCTAQ